MLYIVATPIGNLMDLSCRAVEILQQSDLIAVEDTRRAKILLSHYKITTKIISLHEHNERKIVGVLLKKLIAGNIISLISDAGTPLISDPGYHLVRQAHLANIVVSPIPGPSSVIAAISASGLAVEQFIFVGFLPSKLSQKQKILINLVFERRTMVFFEASSRLKETINCMQQIFGTEREATFCRELTKKFETIKHGNLSTIYNFILANEEQQTKGEIVLVIAGDFKDVDSNQINLHAQNILQNLLVELPLAKAAAIAAKITGISKKELYKYGLFLAQSSE